MLIAPQDLLGSDLGPEWMAKINAAWALIVAEYGFPQTISASLTIPTNRTVVASGRVSVSGSTVRLTIAGTSRLHIV